MPDPALAVLVAVVCLWLLYGIYRLSRWLGPRRDTREAAAWRAARTGTPDETWQHDFIQEGQS